MQKNNTNSDLFSGFVLFAYGGDSRGRTGDLLNAIQALYQLSYTPTRSFIISYFFSLSKRFDADLSILFIKLPPSRRQFARATIDTPDFICYTMLE